MTETGNPPDLVLREAGDGANEHFLAHVETSSERHEVVVAADIVSGSGMLLLARGARVDARLRERLLRHKLERPVEECLSIADGIAPKQILEAAEAALRRNGLALLLDAPEAEEPLPLLLSRLRLTPPLQTMLTLYAGQRPDRLAHACEVALLTLALARRLQPGQPVLQRQLALAGLMHDVGELYIDPAILQQTGPLAPDAWRQIASHPLIGYRVLSSMEGAGPIIAEAVLCHHERLDGFGYPRGLTQAQLPLQSQILAAAEWLAGLCAVGPWAATRARVTTQLVPGEFDPALSGLIYSALRIQASQPAEPEPRPPAPVLAARMDGIIEVLGRYRSLREWITAQSAAVAPELRSALEAGQHRLEQIQLAFSSAGLDAREPGHFMAELQGEAAGGRSAEELLALVAEFAWRLRELERGCMLRAAQSGSTGVALMNALVGRIKGDVRLGL